MPVLQLRALASRQALSLGLGKQDRTGPSDAEAAPCSALAPCSCLPCVDQNRVATVRDAGRVFGSRLCKLPTSGLNQCDEDEDAASVTELCGKHRLPRCTMAETLWSLVNSTGLYSSSRDSFVVVDLSGHDIETCVCRSVAIHAVSVSLIPTSCTSIQHRPPRILRKPRPA